MPRTGRGKGARSAGGAPALAAAGPGRQPSPSCSAPSVPALLPTELRNLNCLYSCDQLSERHPTQFGSFKHDFACGLPNWKQGLQHGGRNSARIFAVSSKDSWCLGIAVLLGLRCGRAVYQAFRKRGDVGRHLGIMVEGQQRSPRQTGAAPRCPQAACSHVHAGRGRFRIRAIGGGLARTGRGRSSRDQRSFGTNASAVLRSRVGLFQLRPPAAPSHVQPAALRLVPSSSSRM